MVKAEASYSDASLAPVVVRLAVLKVLPLLVSVIVPPVELAFKACAWIAPDWPMDAASESVSVPPILAPAIVSAEASVREALSLPLVESVAVANALEPLVSVIAPLVVETFTAAAVIAPVWPMGPAPANVSVPPIVAPEMLNAEASVREALSDPAVARLATAMVLPELVSVMAPLVVLAFNVCAWIAPVCPIPFAPDKVSVPPMLADAMVNVEAS